MRTLSNQCDLDPQTLFIITHSVFISVSQTRLVKSRCLSTCLYKSAFEFLRCIFNFISYTLQLQNFYSLPFCDLFLCVDVLICLCIFHFSKSSHGFFLSYELWRLNYYRVSSALVTSLHSLFSINALRSFFFTACFGSMTCPVHKLWFCSVSLK